MTTTDPQNPYGQPASPYGQAAPAYAATAEDVDARFPGTHRDRFARWFERVVAYLIDALVIGLLPFIVAMFATVTAETTEPTPFSEAEVEYTAAGELAIGLTAVLFLGLWFWNRIHRQGTTGQTIGKKVMKIRLVGEETGQPIGRGKVFLRDLAHIVDGPLYLGYLWPIWDEKRQTFSDKIMNTVVVNEFSA